MRRDVNVLEFSWRSRPTLRIYDSGDELDQGDVAPRGSVMKRGRSSLIPLREGLWVLPHQVLQESQVTLVGQLNSKWAKEQMQSGVRTSWGESNANSPPYCRHLKAKKNDRLKEKDWRSDRSWVGLLGFSLQLFRLRNEVIFHAVADIKLTWKTLRLARAGSSSSITYV